MKTSLSHAPKSEVDDGIVLMQLWKRCYASKKHTTTNTTGTHGCHNYDYDCLEVTTFIKSRNSSNNPRR